MSSVPNETSSVNETPKKVSVAIVGGGIGGLCLAIGLLKYPHLDVQVYEAAASFGEIGAGVAFGPNAERALDLIGPSAREALRKHATTNLWPSHANVYLQYRVGFGEKEGTVICSQKNSAGMQSVHRAHFLDELVKTVPAQRAHFNKRVQQVDEDSDGVTLHFKDGQSARAEVVIGADGVHSKVREHLLGVDVAKSRFTGAICYRALAPMDSAIELLGEEHAQNATMLAGPERALMTYPIEFGRSLNIVAFEYLDHWPHEKWIVPAKYDQIVENYRGWGKPAQGVVKLLNNPDLAIWSMWDSPSVSTYSRGRLAMMGDAAHSMTAFQGQGAGQALEDSCVLQALLGQIHDKKEIPNALAAYDQVRRPRAERVVTTSRDAGYLATMQLEGIKDDLDKMRDNWNNRMHWIWHRNIKAQNEAALEIFKESLP
ncbi:MAG: hypothetical protein Q9222_005695 [Ikaeria aurantiellina]